MKIDLSKYPPGTKFQQRNKSKTSMILVGINPINHKYVVTWQSPITRNIHYQEYNQDGSLSEVGHLCPEHDLVELYPSDKYLVTYQNHALEIHNIVIVDPKSPTEDDLYQQIWMKKEGHQRPKKILSWLKIEE
jgi:hypothetical protein